MEWFYEKNGAQEGPVTEDELKRLKASGEIGDQNLIWKQGMGDWSPYSSVFSDASGPVDCPTCGTKVDAGQLIPAGDRQVCPNCRDSYAQGLKEGVTSTSRLAGGLGTGGMTPNGELRAMGLEALSGKWGMSVVVTLIFMVIQQAIAFIPFIGSLIQTAIAGPMNIGYHRAFLGIYRGEPADAGLVFSEFGKFWRAFGISFMFGLIIGLSALAAALPGIILMISIGASSGGSPEENPLFAVGIFLAAIPGLVVAYYMYLRYAVVYFVASDYPELGVFQVLETSKQMMDGHKMKLFWFGLSYIGWFILGFLALLIGLLWSMTYFYAGFAAFYEDIAEEV
ncbi:MAG: DUF975 family protein [Opitutaceae bacterium]